MLTTITLSSSSYNPPPPTLFNFLLFPSSNGLFLPYLTLSHFLSSMSSDAFLPQSPPPPPTLTTYRSPSSFAQKLGSVGLGYAIAIAFGFLVFVSTVLLASYICCRSAAARRGRRRQDSESDPSDRTSPGETSIYLPRIIFVAEDENDELSLSENVVVGLEHAVINSYPKFQFSKKVGAFGGNDDTVCAICLCDYKESEMLRLLPDCKHYFHVTCVDAWLKLNASCPVCRNSPLPTPLSTPLSEVVPLSQYSDGRRR